MWEQSRVKQGRKKSEIAISENGAGWSHFLVNSQVLWVTLNIEKNRGWCQKEKHRNNGLLNSVTLRAKGRESKPYYF